MSNSQPLAPTAYNVGHILPKLQNDDPDLRYMGLNDLSQLLTAAPANIFSNERPIPARTVDALLRCLQDSNGEVQNMAVKCIGPLVNKVEEQVICVLIEKISTLPADSVVDSSIPALALRQIVVSLPRPSPGAPRAKPVVEAYSAISKAMIPRLTGYTVVPSGSQQNLPKPPPSMLVSDMENGTDSNAMDVLIEVANCFGSMLREAEVTALTKISLKVIRSERTSQVLKKKAVVAMSHFALFLSDKLLASFAEQVEQHLSSESLAKSHRKLYLSLLASVARAIPDKFSPYLVSLAPYALATLSEEEIQNDIAEMEETEERDPEADEGREAALLAVESWLASCPEAMRQFTPQCLDIVTRFLKYDPNLADDDIDEMEDDEDALEGDDFEEDVGGDDEDDTSWKVRRCAAKVAHILIVTRSNGDLLDDGTFYAKIAPALVSRFKEREETVRLEILLALSKLIRITGGETTSAHELSNSNPTGSMAPPTSRKRRRVGSDASMIDSQTNTALKDGLPDAVEPPSSGAFASLEALSAQIVQGLSNLLQTGPLQTKEASIIVLKDLLIALHGKLTNYLSNAIPTVVSAVAQSSSSSTASVGATNGYRIEALAFLGAAIEVQSPQDIQPYVSKILPVIISATHDKYTKVSAAALDCVEHLVGALTPPRSSDARNQPFLSQICKAFSDVASSNEADLEVRRLAIHGLGLLLGQSSLGSGMLSAQDREAGMRLLLNRLSNETTRLTTARAIDSAACMAKKPTDYPSGWVAAVATILVDQFRKASRSLRGACVSAMKTLATNPGSSSQLSRETISQFLPGLDPLIKGTDFHLIGPALLILNAFVNQDPKIQELQNIVGPLCQLLTMNIPSTTLNALILVVRSFGANGIGQPLMNTLLREISMQASPELVGKAVGNLLVTGGDSVGFKVESFVKELNSQKDVVKRCLALGVLGETVFLQGTKSKLTPQFFVERVKDGNQTVAQSAATALGRAGAGNISVYVPVILKEIGNSNDTKAKQLLLLSIREIVNSDSHADLAPFVQELWNQVMEASQTEGGKAVGAESIGRLAIVEPQEFFPQLHNLLTSSGGNHSLRNLVLSALRVTVTSDSPAAHTKAVSNALLPLLKGVLQVIPGEKDLENRRVGLTIVNAAGHSRVDDVLGPLLMDIVPVVLNECKIRTELIREVQMGPFKHKVDDGLEVRKAAYECLYTLFSSPLLPAFLLQTLLPPLVSGVSDDNEVRLLSLLSLGKAIEVYPMHLQPLLTQFIEPFRAILRTKPREQAVKQEIERLDESMRGVIRFALDVNKRYPEGVGSAWAEWWTSVRVENSVLVKQVEEENREPR